MSNRGVDRNQFGLDFVMNADFDKVRQLNRLLVGLGAKAVKADVSVKSLNKSLSRNVKNSFKATKSNKGLIKSTNSLTKSNNAATKSNSSFGTSLLSVTALVGGLGLAFGKLTQIGLTYNKEINIAMGGLRAIVAADTIVNQRGEYLTQSGEYVSAMEGENMVRRKAIDISQRLIVINRETTMGYAELANVFRTAKPAMDGAAWSLSNQMEIIKLTTNAAANFNIQGRTLTTGIDDMARGTWKANSEFGKMFKQLGITKKEFKEAGFSAEYLIDKLKQAGKMQRTAANASVQLTESFRAMLAVKTEPYFDAIVSTMYTLVDVFRDAKEDLSMTEYANEFIQSKNTFINGLFAIAKGMSFLYHSTMILISALKTVFALLKGIAGSGDIVGNLAQQLTNSSEAKQKIDAINNKRLLEKGKNAWSGTKEDYANIDKMADAAIARINASTKAKNKVLKESFKNLENPFEDMNKYADDAIEHAKINATLLQGTSDLDKMYTKAMKGTDESRQADAQAMIDFNMKKEVQRAREISDTKEMNGLMSRGLTENEAKVEMARRERGIYKDIKTIKQDIKLATELGNQKEVAFLKKRLAYKNIEKDKLSGEAEKEERAKADRAFKLRDMKASLEMGKKIVQAELAGSDKLVKNHELRVKLYKQELAYDRERLAQKGFSEGQINKFISAKQSKFDNKELAIQARADAKALRERNKALAGDKKAKNESEKAARDLAGAEGDLRNALIEVYEVLGNKDAAFQAKLADNLAKLKEDGVRQELLDKYKKELERKYNEDKNIKKYQYLSNVDDSADVALGQIEINKAVKEMNELGMAANDIKRVTAQLQTDEIAKQETIYGGMVRYIEQVRRASEEYGKFTNDILTSIEGNIIDGLGKALDTTSDKFLDFKSIAKDTFKAILIDLQKMILKMIVLQGIKMTMGGFGFGAATGGPVPQKLAVGGRFTGNGKVPGYDSTDSDKVNAKLTGGEFVIKRKSVDKYGMGILSRINNGTFGGYSSGGVVGNTQANNTSVGGVVVNNFSNAQVSATQSETGETTLTITQLEQIDSYLGDQFANGHGTTNGAMNAAYSLNRK